MHITIIWYRAAVNGDVPDKICPVIIPGSETSPTAKSELIIGIKDALKATFFAVFASFTNLALSASALGTKYLNEIFTVTREVKDKVSGEIQTTADYSELGILLIFVTLLTLILPIVFVFIINNSKYKTTE